MLPSIAFLGSVLSLMAEVQPLNRATFTDVVNDVAVVKPVTNTRIPVKKDDQVQAPDLVRTGEKSRAELKAPDNTLTRIGANTILSFKQDGRGINLEQGSVLFHSPTGKGGGTIQTAAVTAAVTGTTIIVVCTKDGGFKLLVMEGKGKATLPNGHSVNVGAGQLVFVLPGSKGFSPVYNYHLMQQSQKANLVGGFEAKLDSLPKIEKAIDQQNDLILKGDLVVTNLLVTDGSGSAGGVPVVGDSTKQTVVGDTTFLAALLAAFSKDEVLTTSIFPPDQLFGYQYFALAKTYLGVQQQDYYGSSGSDVPGSIAFVGQNITLQLSALNLAAYAGIPQFVFAASGIMTLPSNLSLSANGPQRVTFYARDTLNAGSINSSGAGLDLTAGVLNIAPNSTIQASSSSSDDLSAESYSNLSLSNVSFINTPGGVSVKSGGTLSMSGGALSGNTNSGNFISNNVNLEAGTDLNLNVASATNTSFTAYGANLNAGNNMTVNNANFTGVVDNVQFTAGNALNITSPTFSPSTSNVRMSATSIVLTNVTFPTSANVDFFTQTGQWRTTTGPLPGGVYLYNCNFGTLISGSGGPGTVATFGGHTITSH